VGRCRSSWLLLVRMRVRLQREEVTADSSGCCHDSREKEEIVLIVVVMVVIELQTLELLSFVLAGPALSGRLALGYLRVSAQVDFTVNADGRANSPDCCVVSMLRVRWMHLLLLASFSFFTEDSFFHVCTTCANPFGVRSPFVGLAREADGSSARIREAGRRSRHRRLCL
jgi:hypothetical protein